MFTVSIAQHVIYPSVASLGSKPTRRRGGKERGPKYGELKKLQTSLDVRAGRREGRKAGRRDDDSNPLGPLIRPNLNPPSSASIALPAASLSGPLRYLSPLTRPEMS